jgi:hypothetical protein
MMRRKLLEDDDVEHGYDEKEMRNKRSPLLIMRGLDPRILFAACKRMPGSGK